jgi:hypothetical protein
VFLAMRDDLTIDPEGLRRDVWKFFSLPVPQAVWDRLKVLRMLQFCGQLLGREHLGSSCFGFRSPQGTCS